MDLNENVTRIQEEARELQEQLRQAELQRAQDLVEHMKEVQRAEEKNRRIQQENREAFEKMEADNRRAREEQQAMLQILLKKEEQRKMNDLARKIQQDANERVQNELWLRQEAEKNLEAGIPPVKYPTGDDITAVRKLLMYQEHHVHLAVAGVSGGGKSSLVNAFRGYSNSARETNAAKTGTVETTAQIGRHSDPAQPLLFWYDVPGAGTLSVPDWQYFNDQGLYIFDIMIIVIDIRFTKIDLALLFNCKRFGIPTFVVRSKSDQHINNIVEDDPDEYDSTSGRKRAYDKFSFDTRQQFESVFVAAGLPPQKVYIVSRKHILGLIRDPRASAGSADEVELIRDIGYEVNKIRAEDQLHTQEF